MTAPGSEQRQEAAGLMTAVLEQGGLLHEDAVKAAAELVARASELVAGAGLGQLGDAMLARAGFVPSEHPRDRLGKFAAGPGGGPDRPLAAHGAPGAADSLTAHDADPGALAGAVTRTAVVVGDDADPGEIDVAELDRDDAELAILLEGAEEPAEAARFNPLHAPAGPGGGQFASAPSGGGGTAKGTPPVAGRQPGGDRKRNLLERAAALREQARRLQQELDRLLAQMRQAVAAHKKAAAAAKHSARQAASAAKAAKASTQHAQHAHKHRTLALHHRKAAAGHRGTARGQRAVAVRRSHQITELRGKIAGLLAEAKSLEAKARTAAL